MPGSEARSTLPPDGWPTVYSPFAAQAASIPTVVPQW